MDNYNLSQTGSDVQGILDKAAQLPDKATLDEEFDAKADKVSTYTKDQVDAKVNQGITAAEAAAYKPIEPQAK